MSAGLVRSVIPAMTVVAVVVLSAMPWGLPSQTRFLLPLLPFAAIHRFALQRPALMPEWLVFVCGLLTDVLTYGPLGFWSLIYLLGLVPARMLATREPGVLAAWLHFCATIAVLALVQWLLASAFFVEAVEWQPFVIGAVAAIFAYPVLELLLRPMLRMWPVVANARFERGG